MQRALEAENWMNAVPQLSDQALPVINLKGDNSCIPHYKREKCKTNHPNLKYNPDLLLNKESTSNYKLTEYPESLYIVCHWMQLYISITWRWTLDNRQRVKLQMAARTNKRDVNSWSSNKIGNSAKFHISWSKIFEVRRKEMQSLIRMVQENSYYPA